MKRALVVEDNDTFRLKLKRLLERYYDFCVFEATNGEDGLLIFNSEKPHIVFLNLSMPKMDGFHFLEKINPFSTSVPIVVLTDENDKENVQKILNYGVEDYILKTKFVTMLKERLEKTIKKIKRTTRVLD